MVKGSSDHFFAESTTKMTELLCLLLFPALKAVGDPKRYWYLIPFAVLAWVVDVILCHTFWALAFGWPLPGEVTISDTLERLCRDLTNPDIQLFIQLALKINRVAGYKHIKAV